MSQLLLEVECQQRRKAETAMLTPDLMAAKGFEENSKSAGLLDAFLLNVARKWVKRRLVRRLRPAPAS
jgi:hypothetical protein